MNLTIHFSLKNAYLPEFLNVLLLTPSSYYKNWWSNLFMKICMLRFFCLFMNLTKHFSMKDAYLPKFLNLLLRSPPFLTKKIIDLICLWDSRCYVFLIILKTWQYTFQLEMHIYQIFFFLLHLLLLYVTFFLFFLWTWHNTFQWKMHIYQTCSWTLFILLYRLPIKIQFVHKNLYVTLLLSFKLINVLTYACLPNFLNMFLSTPPSSSIY